MNSIEKLIQIFSNFPGIGPRQARRFVYYLLTRNDNTLAEFGEHIKDLKKDVVVCSDCQRFFQLQHKNSNNKGAPCRCKICSDQTRDSSILMLVQRDADLESVERNGGFGGVYFVLGGSVPILDKEPEKRIRIKELKTLVGKKAKEGLKEIILGVNWNPEGENTADYVKKELEIMLKNIQPTSAKAAAGKIKISHLGKGLSMGTELEYADSDTLKNALRNRS